MAIRFEESHMKEVFIVSKNPDLSNYLFLLLREISKDEPFSLSVELSKENDLVIIDTETIDPSEVGTYGIEAPIVLFAHKIKPLLIQYTSRYDINGVITLGMEASDFLKTLNSATQRDIFYNDNMISLLFSNKVNEMVEKVTSLTDRENEILGMMMKDMTNEEIAEGLRLSVRTVNAHKGNIMRKIGAKTTSGLIKIILDYSPYLRNES